MEKLTRLQIIYAYAQRTNPNFRKEYGPKVGFYQINQLTDVIETTRYEKVWCKAYWHPTEPDFTEQLEFKVQLSYLFNKFSDGPKELNPQLLINAIIQIHGIETIEGTFNNEPYLSTKIIWSIVSFNNLPLISDNLSATRRLHNIHILDAQNQLNTLKAEEANQQKSAVLNEEDIDFLSLWTDEDELEQLLYDEFEANEIDQQLFEELRASEEGNELTLEEATDILCEAEFLLDEDRQKNLKK